MLGDVYGFGVGLGHGRVRGWRIGQRIDPRLRVPLVVLHGPPIRLLGRWFRWNVQGSGVFVAIVFV
jgi:hypothetical protein